MPIYSAKMCIPQELIEDDIVWSNYLFNQIKQAMFIYFENEWKRIDFEILYGKGSYEEFIFGGAPGL